MNDAFAFPDVFRDLLHLACAKAGDVETSRSRSRRQPDAQTRTQDVHATFRFHVVEGVTASFVGEVLVGSQQERLDATDIVSVRRETIDGRGLVFLLRTLAFESAFVTEGSSRQAETKTIPTSSIRDGHDETAASRLSIISITALTRAGFDHPDTLLGPSFVDG